MKRMKAKYGGRCRECGERIEVGDEILWGRGEGARHLNCPVEPEPEYDDSADAAEAYYADQERAREDAEYNRGRMEAEQYLMNKRLYGSELAEQWEMEREMRDGWDY
jgi:hypothetical protein